ncbi:MAG: ABC transporter permease [Bacteroidota bacterium]
MFRNYWKTAIRTLWKHKSYTAINVLGLSLGITCSLLLFLLVRYLLSFDTFHAKSDRIYRIVRESVRQGSTDYTPGVPIPLPDAFREDFPEVEKVVFTSYFREGLITVRRDEETQNFPESEGLAYVEPTFFQVFDRPLLVGNPKTVLSQPNQAVISEKLAQKYFGEQQSYESVLGKTIQLDKEADLVITGIAEDYPTNTDFPFEMMISYATVKDEMLKNGGWGSVSSDNHCYFLLDKEQSLDAIEARLPEFVDKYHGKDNYAKITLYVQSLQDIHFDTRFSGYAFQNIPEAVVQVLGLVALFLILIACINFINLTTAVSAKRSKEVGIRKTLGGSKSQVVYQFLGETTLITILSVLIALGLAELLLLKINPLLDLAIAIDLLSDGTLVVALVLTIVAVSVISGLYPSWVLARFAPIQALQNKLIQPATRGFTLRKGLVVFQFIIAQVFIIGTLVLISQMQYIEQADLGFRQEAILTIPLPNDTHESPQTLRNELLRLSGVEKASLSSASPTSSSTWQTSFEVEGNPDTYDMEVKEVDQYYMDVYGLELIAGRGLTEIDTTSRVIVNEAFLKKVGIDSPEDAIGKQLELWNKTVPIVGVTKNFHTRSLKHTIGPTALMDGNSYRQVDIQINTANISQTLADIEDRWSAFYPEYTFDYQFVDDAIAEFYEEGKTMSAILATTALVVIFIGCLGLYGLITFMAEQKTKEVGVRKVLGASVASIVGLFSVEFIKLLSLAFLVAAPIAYFVMNGWLQRFEYKIDLGIGLFLTGIGATLVIALLTVSYRSIKAAMANPVDSLRNE